MVFLEVSGVRPRGKASGRLLQHASTEGMTAPHCPSRAELDLCISMPQLLRSTRVGKLFLTLKSAQRKLSSLALQEQRESPPSLPGRRLVPAYPSYKRRKFLPVHVRKAGAIQYFLKGIKKGQIQTTKHQKPWKELKWGLHTDWPHKPRNIKKLTVCSLLMVSFISNNTSIIHEN